MTAPNADERPSISGVLVGDDGSARATEAIAYAAQEALRRGCDLHVVRAWNVKNAVRPADYSPGLVPSLQEFSEATAALTRKRAEAVAASSGARVHAHVVHGAASRTLLDLSHQADVLVVGAQGLSGMTGRLLGSVAITIVREAGCPVIVVRPRVTA